MTRLPVFRSTGCGCGCWRGARWDAAGDVGRLENTAVGAGGQDEVGLVTASVGGEGVLFVAGVSLLATHTTVSWVM